MQLKTTEICIAKIWRKSNFCEFIEIFWYLFFEKEFILTAFENLENEALVSSIISQNIIKNFSMAPIQKKMSRSIMRKNNKYNVWRLLLLRIQSSINNYRSKASISICLGITWGLSKSLYSVWLWESSIYDEDDHRFSFVSINKEHNKKRAFIFDFTNMVQQHLT